MITPRGVAGSCRGPDRTPALREGRLASSANAARLSGTAVHPPTSSEAPANSARSQNPSPLGLEKGHDVLLRESWVLNKRPQTCRKPPGSPPGHLGPPLGDEIQPALDDRLPVQRDGRLGAPQGHQTSSMSFARARSPRLISIREGSRPGHSLARGDHHRVVTSACATGPSSFCHSSLVTTRSTRSSPNAVRADSATVRCARWIGSKVPQDPDAPVRENLVRSRSALPPPARAPPPRLRVSRCRRNRIDRGVREASRRSDWWCRSARWVCPRRTPP